jgi:hypothetical protein
VSRIGHGLGQLQIPVLSSHVEVEVDGFVADVFGYRLAQVVQNVAEVDLRPFLDEQPDLGLPLSPRTAGDQRHLACQPICPFLLSAPAVRDLERDALQPLLDLRTLCPPSANSPGVSMRVRLDLISLAVRGRWL